MPPGAVSPWSAGLRCRCPRCGEGALFAGVMPELRERCESCGLDFRAQDSGDGPAVFVILILGALIVAGAFILETRVAPPIWVHLAIWLPATLIGAIALLRPFKATLIALQYRHRDL